MFRILLDTCVWLDLAKDYRQESLLASLEELVQRGLVALIVPRTVVVEFARNKDRIVEDSTKSISSALKRTRQILDVLGAGRGKRIALDHLSELDHKLPQVGDAAATSVNRIEKLLATIPIIEITDSVLLRAAKRGVDRRAPFHRQKNGIDDSILIEVYSDLVRERSVAGVRFAFVTHNVKDFSEPTGDRRTPHADVAVLFSRVKSLYMISLAETVRRVEPGLVTAIMLEREFSQEPRRLAEIIAALDELFDKVWYNRHQLLRQRVELGITKIVEEETFPVVDLATRPIQRDVWEGALRAARRVEKRYGVDKLGPWSDFEWGMLSGKLSALRWVLGDEWDNLDS